MQNIFAQAADVTGSTTTTVSWLTGDPAIIVALLFALAGAVFVSIYYLRRRRSSK